MNSRFRQILGWLLAGAVPAALPAQQQPVVAVEIQSIAVFNGAANNGSVVFYRVTAGGSGYVNGATVTVGGGGGAGATARAVVNDGSVVAVLVVNPGAGYSTTPTVTINPVSGAGVGATARAYLGDYFGAPFSAENESYGAARTEIGISALAVGTNPAGGFTYKFFADEQPIGTLTPNPPNGSPGTIGWTPPQPGAYFLTVEADDGISTAVRSLPVRYFSTGTAIVGPVDNTLVPHGSSVVIQAAAMPAPLGNGDDAFVQRIDFYADGQLVGTDGTYPYSYIYTPTTNVPSHVIEARAFDNHGNQISPNGTATRNLVMVPPIGTPPTCAITSPLNNTTIAIPDYAADANAGVTIAVDAFSSGGTIRKVELYVDGVLFSTTATYPYSFKWKPQVVGPYQLVALAYDDKNNVVAPPTTHVTVAAAPTVVIISPTSGASVAGGSSMAVSANASSSNRHAIVSVQFFDTGKFVGESTMPNSGSTSLYSISYTPAPQKDSEGNVIPSVLTALAIDEKGLSKLSAGVTFNVTSGGVPPPPPIIGQPPTVSLTAPVASSQIGVGTAVSLVALASDPDGNVSTVQFMVNGATVESDSTYPYSATWTPTSLGPYAITAKVSDNDGNIVTSTTVNVSVVDPSAQPPSVRIVGPASPLTTGIPVSVQAEASDDVAIARVQFFLNGQPLEAADTEFPYLVQWTPNSPGNYTLVARATDNAGNQTTSAPVTVGVTSGAAPTVSLTSPAGHSLGAAGAFISLAAIAGDLDGTVANVRFLANGIVIGNADAPPYTASWKPTAAGTYTLQAQATDNAGNVTLSAPVTLVVLANQVPVPQITAPANGATVRVGVGLTATASVTDVDGTIASVEFFANGVSLGTSTTPPYKAQFKPVAEGVYRLNAVAVDNAGAVGTSAPVLVVASLTAADTVATGTYQGAGEAGSFALVAATGNGANFIGYSVVATLKKVYFHENIPMDLSGGFHLDDANGMALISGRLSETAASGTLDGGRLMFIGLDTGYFPSGTTVSAGYYTGRLTGRETSSVAVIVGEDASLTLRVADGSFEDAGGGNAGMIDASGAFSFVTMRGNRVSGRLDPATGVLSGSLSGSNAAAFTATSASLRPSAETKVQGAAREVGSNIFVAKTGRTYDQVLLEGASASVTADPGQITRVSFLDLSGDIVQVEFSGAGRLALTLQNASGPTAASSYNQPDVRYMKGHAGIVITGANDTTHVSVFTVGSITAVNQALFKAGVTYDGVADIGYLAIMSANGRFGGVRTANASYVSSSGFAGICAPGVQFDGPVYVGDITASGAATPMLVLGSAGDVQINGGDLWQANGQPIQISGLNQLRLVDGTTSHGVTLYAQHQRARLEENGVDVTAQVVAAPAP